MIPLPGPSPALPEHTGGVLDLAEFDLLRNDWLCHLGVITMDHGAAEKGWEGN